MGFAGLNLLLELLVMFESSNVATQFYQTYYMQLVNEIFAVMTGGLRACPACFVWCPSGVQVAHVSSAGARACM